MTFGCEDLVIVDLSRDDFAQPRNETFFTQNHASQKLPVCYITVLVASVCPSSNLPCTYESVNSTLC
jgi:hypothetical protein